MFFEFLYRLLSFDVNWLVGFIFDPHSLFWLFLMLATAFYFYPAKKWLWATVFFLVFNFAFVDIAFLSGWGIPFGMMGIIFVWNVVKDVFLDKDSFFGKYPGEIAVIGIAVIWTTLWFLQGG
jgi:hypothetical protein